MKFKELIVYFTFITIMILQNLLYIGFNQLFLISVISICLFLLDKNQRIYFLFFIIPFRSSLPFNLIIFLFIILILFTLKVRFSRIIIVFFIISLIELISSIDSNNFFTSLRFLSTLFTILLIVIISPKEVFLSGKTIGLYYASGFIFSSLLYVIVFSIYFNIELLFIGQARLGAIYNQFISVYPNYVYFLNINSNEIGINAIFSIIFLTNYYKKSPFFLVLSLLSLFIGILTYSRTFFLAFALYILYVIFRTAIIKSLSYKLLFYSFFLALFSTLFFFNFDFLNEIFNRYTLAASDDRINITIEYLNNLKVIDIFFGKGAINYYFHYNQVFSLHNGFLEVFFSYGFFGLIILFSIFLFLFRESKSNALMKLGLLVFIISINFHQLLGSVQLMFILSIFFVLVKNKNYNNRTDNKLSF